MKRRAPNIQPADLKSILGIIYGWDELPLSWNLLTARIESVLRLLPDRTPAEIVLVDDGRDPSPIDEPSTDRRDFVWVAHQQRLGGHSRVE